MLKTPLASSALGIITLVTAGVLASSAQASPVSRLSTLSETSRGFDLVAATTSTDGSTAISQPAISDDVVGIVKSVNGSNLEIKLPDGLSKFYTAPPSFATSTLSPGSFVEVVLDESQNIQSVKIPSVEKVISGVISKIDGENVTLELADGTQETTVINESTAQRMNLAPGVPLTVTSYAGLAATKLCPTLLATCCQKPAPPLPPLTTPRLPTGGGEMRIPLPQKW